MEKSKFCTFKWPSWRCWQDRDFDEIGSLQTCKHKIIHVKCCSYRLCSQQRKKKLTNRELVVASPLNNKSNIKKNETIIGISLSYLSSLSDFLKGNNGNSIFMLQLKKLNKLQNKLENSGIILKYVSYVKIQDIEPESKTGFAEYFVSYAWNGNFLQTVHLFVDEHKILTCKELEDRLRSLLKTIGKAGIVFTPGQNPLAVNRCFEWAQFELLNIAYSYCVPRV